MDFPNFRSFNFACRLQYFLFRLKVFFTCFLVFGRSRMFFWDSKYLGHSLVDYKALDSQF